MARRPVPETPPGTSGLKRHPALVPLSRDHHLALVQALGLRRAAEAQRGPGAASVCAVAEGFLAFYRDEMLGHIADEEEVLLPLAARVDPEGAQRVRAEHDELHELVALLRQALSNGADPRPLMKELGELLDDHVRFEERAFFESVQSRLAADQITELERALEAHRQDRGRGPSCTLQSRERFRSR